MSLKTERELTTAQRGIFGRAKAAAQQKNHDYTISLMQALLKEEPLFLEGRRYLRAVEIEKYKALSSFQRQMISMKVGSAAMKLSTAGKKEPAEQLFLAEEVLALDPFQNKANMLVGEAGSKLGFAEFRAFAYETLARGKDVDGKPDKAILNALAGTYMELKDYEKAEKTYNRILEMDPRDGDALSGLKNASAAHTSRSGGWETHGNDYRNALKDKKEAVDLEQASKVVKSQEAIEEQIALNYAKYQEHPENPAFSKTIAKLFEQKGDFSSAVDWYQASFDAGGKVDSSLEKVIGDLKLKKSDQELQQLVADQEQQTDPEAQAQLAAAIEQKRLEMAQVRLEQAEARVRAQPNDGEFRFQLGEALYHAGQYKRAGEEFQLALKQPSVRYPALNYMGLSFMKRGMLDFAVKQFSTAKSELLGMDELKKEIVYNLGLAYEALKQPEKALEQFKEIYEHDMSYRDVAKRVEDSYGGGDAPSPV
jgi:tetratricopeptide (TPR) repeat protein